MLAKTTKTMLQWMLDRVLLHRIEGPDGSVQTAFPFLTAVVHQKNEYHRC